MNTDRNSLLSDLIYYSEEEIAINSSKLQILDLLLSTYESAIEKNNELFEANNELINAHDKLIHFNELLEQKVKLRTNELSKKNDLLQKEIKERIQAEENLLKLNKAVNNSKEVIFMTNKEGVFTFVNSRFSEMYGFTAKRGYRGKNSPYIEK